MTDATLATGAITFATAGANMLLSEATTDAFSQVPWEKIGSGVSFVVALIFALRFMTNLYAKSQEKMELQFQARIDGLEKDKGLLIEANRKLQDALLESTKAANK